MSFVYNLILMLFVVFNPSLSTTHPESETKEESMKTSVQPSTEERVKARLKELGIPEGVLFTLKVSIEISYHAKGDLSSLPIHSKETRESECPDVSSDVIAYRQEDDGKII